MKAVLVIDMPSRCFNCPIHEYLDAEEGEHEFMVFCKAEHWRESTTHTPVENLEERPSWCPLMPLPQKMTMEKALKMERCGSIRDIYTTWDACLAEITGETK